MIGINTFVTFPILIKIFKLSLNYIQQFIDDIIYDIITINHKYNKIFVKYV